MTHSPPPEDYAMGAGIRGLVLATSDQRNPAIVVCAQAALTLKVPCRIYIGTGPSTTQVRVAQCLGAVVVSVNGRVVVMPTTPPPHFDPVACLVEDAIRELCSAGWQAWA